MIPANPAGVKAAPVRTLADSPRQIQFAFRADPTALDDVGLDPTARDLMVLILDNARLRGGRCRLSNGTMGRILGRCPMTISRALGRLQAAGLILRELVAGGRVRTGIVVTWEAVQVQEPGRLTEQCTVRRERLTGSTSAPKGVRRERLTDQSPIQSEISDADRSSLRGEEEDAEQAALFAELGPAAFLRAMIAKGREAAGKPALAPAPAEPARASQNEPTPPALPYSAPVADRPAPAKPWASTTTTRRVEATPTSNTGVKVHSPIPLTFSPSPCVPADQVAATVAKMTRGLADQLRAEDVGRRCVGPKKLARQLAEIRRRHPGGRPR